MVIPNVCDLKKKKNDNQCWTHQAGFIPGEIVLIRNSVIPHNTFKLKRKNLIIMYGGPIQIYNSVLNVYVILCQTIKRHLNYRFTWWN